MQPTESNSKNRKQYLENAKTHLENIERGLLNLSGVVKQGETLKSLHSSAEFLTRGAANHNLETVQQVAQFFEDCFGIMRTASVVSDKKLEEILWRIFEMFKGLLEMHTLDEPVEYTDPIEQAVWQKLKPQLGEAENHLKSRILHEEATISEIIPDNNLFDEQVNAELEAMEIILNGENPSHYRNELKEHCQALEQIGVQGHLMKWVELLKTAQSAIAATENSVKIAAECAIADIREAQKLVAKGQSNTIKPSPPLKAMSMQLSSLSSPWDTQTSNDEDEIKLEIPRREEINQQETIADQPEISRFGKRAPSPSDETLDLNLDPWVDEQKTKSKGKSNYQHSPNETLIELWEDEEANPAEDNSQWNWNEDDLALNDNDESLDDLFPADETQDLYDPLEELLNDSNEGKPQETATADDAIESSESEEIYEPLEDLGGLFETSPGTFLQGEGSQEEEAYDHEYEEAVSDISAFSFSHDIQYYEAIEQLEELIKAPAQVQPDPQAIDTARLEAYIEESPLHPADLIPEEPAEGEIEHENQSPPTSQPVVSSLGGYEQTVKVPVRLMDNLNNLIGELVVNRNSLEQDQERLRQFLDNLLEQVQNLNELGVRMQDLYERSLLEAALVNSKSHYATPSLKSRGNDSGFGSYMSNNEQYNPLEMDRFSGFHTLSQEMIELIVRVRESSSDIEFLVDKVEQEARVFRQVTTQLQEGFTSARMVPFSQVSNRLPRAVRSIAIKLQKKAKLQVEGEATLVDKMILEQLYDPMTHLVNNAITHGIEFPEKRKKAGKPETGLIKIEAQQKGNQTIISISDDGAGLDAERIRKKAIEKGLISQAEAQNLPDLDIFDFIFHPGFSTQDKAGDFSGRGVGMDVVRSSLNKLRGTINIDSRPGIGTTFTIVLPLTLSITTALRCKLNQSDIAFPVDGVEEQIQTTKDKIIVNEKGERFIRSQKTSTQIPFKPLSELLSYNRTLTRTNVFAAREEAEEISIVVLQSTGNLIAVQVDQVLVGQQEVVIKQLTGPVPKPVGISGVTVTSDGSVMAIADVLELTELFHGRVRQGVIDRINQPVLPIQEEDDSDPMVLIVDDSITVRELLSMTFKKAGYRVEQARDGKDAWEKLRAGLACDMMFCDIEMPRMDGLELLSRVKEEERFTELPVGMLTSRGAERHRQMAARLGAKGYFTKPYLEEMLLDAAKRMLQGENMIERQITSGLSSQ